MAVKETITYSFLGSELPPLKLGHSTSCAFRNDEDVLRALSIVALITSIRDLPAQWS